MRFSGIIRNIYAGYKAFFLLFNYRRPITLVINICNAICGLRTVSDLHIRNEDLTVNGHFVAKLEISMKESSECVFWIRLLAELGDINGATSDRLLSELSSIRNMLGASIRTAKAKT